MIYDVSGDFEPINTYKNRQDYRKHKIQIPLRINIHLLSLKKIKKGRFSMEVRHSVKSCQQDRGLILSDLGSRSPFSKSIESLKKNYAKISITGFKQSNFIFFSKKALKSLFLNLFSIFKNPVCSIFHSTFIYIL